jgi:magnesium chelatase family protein
VGFEGIETRAVDVQVPVDGFASLSIARNLCLDAGGFNQEARERVRSRPDRLVSRCPRGESPSISRLPILPKEGSHYDLPIALGLMAPSARFRPMR